VIPSLSSVLKHSLDDLQSVFELQDGSALFVTVAKYLSPAFHSIDKIGITPDVMCVPKDGDGVALDPSAADDPPRAIEQDSCVMLAEKHLDSL
jgi:carboxyl-terminal processing protease